MDPSWVYRQYDHQLFLNTVVGPGGDAALLRLKAPGLGLAAARRRRAGHGPVHRRQRPLVRPRPPGRHRPGRGRVGPQRGVRGRPPVALVNCLNFGNPEHPEVMWQLSEAIDGMAEACRALGIPVIGGNVSLYNESRGRDIDPTPVVGRPRAWSTAWTVAAAAGRPGRRAT